MKVIFSPHAQKTSATVAELHALASTFHQTAAQSEIGFFRLEHLKQDLKQVHELLPRLQSFSHLIHLGLGGSVLGPKALTDSLLASEQNPNKKITYLDNLDPEDFYATLEATDLSQTAFYVVSKSGETLETKAMLHALLHFLEKTYPAAQDLAHYLQQHFFFCTDPQKGLLRQFCQSHQLTTLPLAANLGGRFSVISSVGLLPLAFLHANGKQATMDFVQAATKARDELQNNLAPACNLAYALFHQAVQAGVTETVFMPYVGRLKTFAQWFVQLWGESLGKQRLTPPHTCVGLTPPAAIKNNFSMARFLGAYEIIQFESHIFVLRFYTK